jgi:hypothetical protein
MMAVPPQFRKAAKRRMDAALPTPGKPTAKNKVATFRNPGNKAGTGLMQKRSGSESPTENAADTGPETPMEERRDAGQPAPISSGTFLGLLGNAPKKKPKTKVQPAAARKIMAMRMMQGQ